MPSGPSKFGLIQGLIFLLLYTNTIQILTQTHWYQRVEQFLLLNGIQEVSGSIPLISTNKKH